MLEDLIGDAVEKISKQVPNKLSKLSKEKNNTLKNLRKEALLALDISEQSELEAQELALQKAISRLNKLEKRLAELEEKVQSE